LDAKICGVNHGQAQVIQMSDWNYLESVRVRVASRTVPPQYCSTTQDGFNGLFRFQCLGKSIRCIASDGEGWRHVSVSIEYETRVPSWEIMCKVKDFFWSEEDVVVQFHPKKSEYVNYHQGCLHLWQPWSRNHAEPFPTPPSILVGPKS
jgi:hypothetical protein